MTLLAAAAVFALIGVRGWAAWDELVLDYDVPPVRLEAPKPVYPEDARRRGLEGVVVMEFSVDRNGRVETVAVLESVPGLDDAAMRCLCASRFRPASRRGTPVRTTSQAPVRFSLDGDDGIRGGFVGSRLSGAGTEGPWMACPR